AEDIVCEAVYDEMDVVNAKMGCGLSDITPRDLEEWSLAESVVPITEKYAPVLLRVIRSAAMTSRSAEKNTQKDRDAVSGCNVIVTQIGNFRSQHNLRFPAIIGLFSWATGSAVQTMDTLHKLGLSISYDSIRKLLKSLAKSLIAEAGEVARGPHAMCYDNINISTSIHVEQRTNGPAKVQSGTFPMLYAIENHPLSAFDLEPIMERARTASDLTYADIRPTSEETESMLSQFEAKILSVLTEHSTPFKEYADHPLLQHVPRRPHAPGHCTKEFPLMVTTIDEADVLGNIRLWENVYLGQMVMRPPELGLRAPPQLGPGIFHTIMNWIWRLLAIHRGSLHQIGSLTYLFDLISKVRLGGDKPDYHALLSALTQIFDGLILNAWRRECGNLHTYAATHPTPEALRAMARQILLKYATPMREPSAKSPSSNSEDAD
ncbi:hypothetical protein PLICRDRAFT_77559, partial [Plicaturopsis crispa FD-325 SS-3]